MSRAALSSHFMRIGNITKDDPLKVSDRYKPETDSFLTCDDQTIKLWT